MNLIKSMSGYKATNADMTCLSHKFELGTWYEVTGELEMCKNGFHFCEFQSGVFSYYPGETCRVFKVEAEDVLDTPASPGANRKRVCRRIRLVEEIFLVGDKNTGGYNTGDKNTGDKNTGGYNTGDKNTGDGNTGDKNTGDGNTGYGNTGGKNTGGGNTGYRNTGGYNTGDWNTGEYNTGDWNTGDKNTGDGNTGYGNATNYSPGFFCTEEPVVVSFNEPVHGITRDEFCKKYSIYKLGILLTQPEDINFDDWKHIPNITPEKLKRLHEKFLTAAK